MLINSLSLLKETVNWRSKHLGFKILYLVIISRLQKPGWPLEGSTKYSVSLSLPYCLKCRLHFTAQILSFGPIVLMSRESEYYAVISVDLARSKVEA